MKGAFFTPCLSGVKAMVIIMLDSGNFESSGVMRFFREISDIPRASFHEEKIADYIEKFAAERSLECYRDKSNNVLVNLHATPGYENREPLLFQGHTDMVCEKNAGVSHDFSSEPLKLYVENGWLHADGTTLGADDGVAVALMLFLLDGGVEPHPACQCLFTSSEEVGLIGIKSFDFGKIFARTMINLDSPDESEIIVGCAGGVRSDVTFTPDFETSAGKMMKISLRGLSGGHSGEDITYGRANACKLLGRILLTLDSDEKTGFSLCSLNGGTKDNAIPREAQAVISASDLSVISERLDAISREIKAELSDEDSGFTLTCESAEYADALSEKDKKNIISFMNSIGNGVLEMSKKIPGLAEYSRNLGVIKTENGQVIFTFSSRSAIEAQLDYSQNCIDTLAGVCGAETKHYSRYPGWNYSGSSNIAQKYSEACERLYGIRPKLSIIHAGLECGIIRNALPDMDIISCGPNVSGLHSPDEKLELESFSRVTEIISSVLRGE